ncbi:MAG TPA: phosphatidylserine decarboxylase [Pilimelia sp.]|nr:phosphatidylserine decarboxylase [Pilimelia sp.]
MTQSPAATAPGPSGPVRLGERAARALTTDLTRHNGTKTGLLVGATAGSGVLTAAVEGLLPGDTLTVVGRGGPEGTPAELRLHVAGLGSWVASRVRVVESIAEADPADVLVVAEPLTGPADEARGTIEGLTKYLAAGGVLAVAAPVAGGGAAAELARQQALFGVGSDLVLRNTPPVRVHRLRFSPADPAVAGRLGPAYRTSSVPLTRGMHIDSNGVAAAGIALGLAALARSGRPGSKLWLLPALAAPAVAAFFRDPERDVPDDDAAVVAASDGKVLAVERVRDARFGPADAEPGPGEEFLRIAVFLSVFDVHVNRSPVPGRVRDYFVTDGGFAAAMKPAAEHNVAAYTVLDTPRGTVVVAQRTGLVARRIVQRAPVGALLAKGERFGLIRFGSRTDVYLPADRARAAVAPGDRVLGGSSVIAHWL